MNFIMWRQYSICCLFCNVHNILKLFSISDSRQRYSRFLSSSSPFDLLNDFNSLHHNRLFDKSCASFFHRTSPWIKHGYSLQHKSNLTNDWRVFDFKLWLGIFRRLRIYFSPHYFYPFAIHQIKKPTVIWEIFDYIFEYIYLKKL